MWRAAIEVPLGAELEYKLVHVTPGYCRWEEADNHHFTATRQVPNPKPCQPPPTASSISDWRLWIRKSPSSDPL